MVCDRCKAAVHQLMVTMGFKPINVELGEVTIAEDLSAEQLADVKKQLSELGFELLCDKQQRIIDKIRTAVIEMVHYEEGQPEVKLSEYLSSKLNADYSSLSKLFSSVTGMSIEKYVISQRIERAKELIFYDELSLTEIAYRLHYSSVAYLSSQFKSVTGMTPTQFKNLKVNTRRSLDKV